MKPDKARIKEKEKKKEKIWKSNKFETPKTYDLPKIKITRMLDSKVETNLHKHGIKGREKCELQVKGRDAVSESLIT